MLTALLLLTQVQQIFQLQIGQQKLYALCKISFSSIEKFNGTYPGSTKMYN